MSKSFSPNKVFEFLNGRYYALNAIEGQFNHSYWYSRAFKQYFEYLYHTPTANGKQSPAYQSTAAELEDDWDTNLTDNIERYCAIALELGYEYSAE